MDKGLAEQVDERLLSVNPTDAQQDYIIMTANHRSPCQPHLQMEKCFPEKVMNIIMLKNICWPSRSPLNVVVGETGDFWWVFEIFCHLYSCYAQARSDVLGLKLPSSIHTGSGRALLIVCWWWWKYPVCYNDWASNNDPPAGDFAPHFCRKEENLHLEENLTNGTFWYCRLLPKSILMKQAAHSLKSDLSNVMQKCIYLWQIFII